MVTMDMAMLLAKATRDNMDTHMPTTMAITMARGPLMPSLKLTPLLLSIMAITDMDTLLPLPIMDTMDTHMSTTMDTTMARGPLMLSLLLMLPMATMDMLTTHITMDMLIMDTHMVTMDSMDIITNLLLFAKN